MRFGSLAYFALALAAGAARASADDSTPLQISQAPGPVAKAIQARVGDGVVEEIDRDTDGGEVSYDVTYSTKSGDEKGFNVGWDGALLSTEINLPDAPPAVQKTIHDMAAGWQLDELDQNTDGTFDVSVENGAHQRDFDVAGDGTLMSESLSWNEMPLPVQKTIEGQAAGWKLGSIDKNLDDLAVTYDVEATRNGQTKGFTVGEDGTLMSIDVALSEVPAAAAAAIQRAAGSATVASIDHNFDPTGDSFDVVAAYSSGRTFSFSVGIDGTEQSMEVLLAETPPAVRSTIQQEIGEGRIVRIDKILATTGKAKGTPYDVEGWKDGKPFNFSVGERGKFQGVDVE